MMIYLAGLVGFLLVLTTEARVGNSSEPSSFCSDTPECLLFDLVCKTKEYEIRRYDSVKWVSTSFTLTTKGQDWRTDFIALGKAFWRVKEFLDEHGIGMKAAPGLVKVPEGSESWFSRLTDTHVYTLKFLLPSDHQSSNLPSTDQVEIDNSPEVYVYVRSYEGWVTADADEAKQLLKSLGLTNNDTPHYAVGYNSPFSSNRHSEVWVIADGKPPCPTEWTTVTK